MKVYVICHEIMGTGWTTQFPEDFVEDLREELIEQDEEAMPFLQSLSELNPGQSASLGNWTIKCGEMTQEALENLPEFEGW